MLSGFQAFSGEDRLKKILPEASLHLRPAGESLRKRSCLPAHIAGLLLHILYSLLQLFREFCSGLYMGRCIVLHRLFHSRDALLQRLQDAVHRALVLVR